MIIFSSCLFLIIIQHQSAILLARVMNDTGRISGLIAWNLLDMMWAMFYVVGIFGIMLALNWKLALWIMLIVPGLVLLTSVFPEAYLKMEQAGQKAKIQ